MLEVADRELSYRDGSRDALLVASKTFALFPAHRLQHLVSNVVAVEAVLCWLLVVTTQEERTCFSFVIQYYNIVQLLLSTTANNISVELSH